MTALDELTEAELLDHAEEVSRTQRECEAQVLRIALQHAILNNPETLDPAISKLPGRERARRFGGVGTPEVAEFAAAALGGRPHPLVPLRGPRHRPHRRERPGRGG